MLNQYHLEIIIVNTIVIFLIIAIFVIILKKLSKRYFLNLKALNNELDNKNSQISLLNNEIVKLKNENLQLYNELKDLKGELDNKNSQILLLNNEIGKLKNELTAMQDVFNTLTALLKGKKTNIKKIETIEEIEKFIFKEFIPAIDDLNIFKEKDFYMIRESFLQWKLTRIKEWRDGKIILSLCGKFSTGKSSIINSVLKNSLLPVDSKPTTAVPTYICHGYESKVYYEDKEGVIREIDEDTFKNINHVKLKDFPISFFIKYFVVFADLSSFRELIILDTPGHSSGKQLDKERTDYAVNTSDVVLYTVDIQDGTLTKDADNVIEFIRNLKIDELYIIINKSDGKPPSEREKVKKYIQDLMNKKGVKCKDILIYSAKKNIDNCHEKLTMILKKIKVNKETKTIFDELLKMSYEAIRKLKAEYISKLNSDQAKKIEQNVYKLNEFNDKIKSIKLEVLK